MCWTSLYTNKHKLISDVDVIPTLPLHIVYPIDGVMVIMA
jgi:hypothetical protein